MAMTRDELLSQALMGVAVIERVMVPERGELVDEMLDSLSGSDTRYEELKTMYLQLLYAASMLAAHGADEAQITVPELLDKVRGNMLAARLSALGDS
jgi:hypothetical protein